MYWPAHFTQTDHIPLWEFVRDHPFGLLLTQGQADRPDYTPLPWIVTQRGLISHIARANPQLQSLTSPVPATLVFCGPNAYISPSWYDTTQTVPTWNYALVEVSGRVCLESEERTDEGLRALIETMERRAGTTWDVSQSDQVWERLRGGIVGLWFEVEQVRGKMKLSQNKAVHERERIAHALDERGACELARLMRGVDEGE